MGRRRDARERILGLLYEAEAKAATPAQVLADLPVPPDPFVADVVAGVGERGAEVDSLIVRFAIDWTLPRMPVVDRTLLRMATYELLYRNDVPTGVIISQAVELATEYSTDESSRFVNGVLAAVANATRGSSADPAEDQPTGPGGPDPSVGIQNPDGDATVS